MLSFMFFTVLGFIFNLYLYLLLLRFWMQKFRARATNPYCNFVLKMTNRIVRPLQARIPGYLGFDFAIITLIIVLQCAFLWLSYFLVGGAPGFSLAVIVVAQLLKKMVLLYFVLVFLASILSWFSSRELEPLVEIVNVLTARLFRYTRHYIPMVGRIDLSALVILILCQLILALVVNPLLLYGVQHL